MISIKYSTEKINAVYYGNEYAITNHTPIIHKDDRQELKNYIEKVLYAVFSKYQSKKK
ncbi:hypothetical protein [Acutalibacter muris]|uniref:hypothetical protein n=1 Tax=Acutalibacter muris TaxID=1796620 RepID=UPI0025B73D9E|nr:hypothetical protein [Acutalibacter muris]